MLDLKRKAWLEATYKADEQAESGLLQEFLETFYSIVDLCREDNVSEKNLERLDEINKYFLEADLDKMPVMFSTALLRYTFMAKPALKDWPNFLERVKTQLAAKGEDPIILSGLK